MIRFLKAIAPAALLAVAGCATPFTADVSRFQALPAPQGQSFAIVPSNPKLSGGLEFAHYADLVADRLAQLGYVKAANTADANLLVSLDYGIDKGRERVRSTPGFGPGYGRIGFGYGWGPYHPYFGYGRRAFIYGYNDPFLFGGYDDIESFTIYQSELVVKIDRSASRERVFEGTAKAMSTDNDLTTLVPNLIQAMFTDFPGNSGKTVRITVAPPEKHARR